MTYLDRRSFLKALAAVPVVVASSCALEPVAACVSPSFIVWDEDQSGYVACDEIAYSEWRRLDCYDRYLTEDEMRSLMS